MSRAITYTAPSRSGGLSGAAAWVLALLLVVALVGATYIYLNEHSKVRDLQQQNQQLQSQVSQMQNLQSSSGSQPSSGGSSAGSGSASSAQPTNVYRSTKGVAIIVYQPKAQSTVSSPLGVVGQAPGRWSFEASFPVMLKDSTGKILANATAKMQGNWMTSSNVLFAASLIFDKPSTPTGTLVLKKDNPSGLSENDDSVSIPVKF